MHLAKSDHTLFIEVSNKVVVGLGALFQHFIHIRLEFGVSLHIMLKHVGMRILQNVSADVIQELFSAEYLSTRLRQWHQALAVGSDCCASSLFLAAIAGEPGSQKLINGLTRLYINVTSGSMRHCWKKVLMSSLLSLSGTALWKFAIASHLVQRFNDPIHLLGIGRPSLASAKPALRDLWSRGRIFHLDRWQRQQVPPTFNTHQARRGKTARIIILKSNLLNKTALIFLERSRARSPLQSMVHPVSAEGFWPPRPLSWPRPPRPLPRWDCSSRAFRDSFAIAASSFNLSETYFERSVWTPLSRSQPMKCSAEL